MAKAKKFGTFAGVFTPSLLTILGVIMYLRLGWVVGEAGLLFAIGIILVAHVISISTGLSVSSISTDKKVKAGGLYYILSRSLGLPIGGAIGITLFIGTALSIALYLIGFSESFLNQTGLTSGYMISNQTIYELQLQDYHPKIIEGIQQMLNQNEIFTSKKEFVINLEQNIEKGYFSGEVRDRILELSRAATKNDLRITATITALAVSTIAFISTSFAIRTQFFILTAIAISLLSIFFSDKVGTPSVINFSPPVDGTSLSVIFGIFFPAVTGFTAGVAMSGDLKDPKRTIPLGTMLAIGIGLLVYLALAFFMAFNIEPQLLRSDRNILQKIALIDPSLVLAGIWGATLSSALGGILGAPRILQAMSMDRVTPKIFARGVGKSNEPRNALILTFLIAEAGILIGELDAIAEVVSMFYLAAYGFINFACLLEGWASSDFRPQFKISPLISLVGTISIFFAMVFLNLTAMLVAVLIIGAIFLYLVRKQIAAAGEDGDIWDGVWTSVIRRGLYLLVNKETKARNWRPNIILFSGGAQARPHLIEFGKTLVGGLGFLSNFQLVEQESSRVTFSKPQQLVPTSEDSSIGLFTRQQDCTNIYEGMETIARTYGFSGLDPNTILLGWGGDAKDPMRFSTMIYSMIRLDYNILMMNYEKNQGFGKKERIDIWWRINEYSLLFTLKLIQFIQKAEDWRKVQIYLFIVNEDELNRSKVQRFVNQLLEDMRIDAIIRIINFENPSEPLVSIIQRESVMSDLIILGLPRLEQGQEDEFLSRRDEIARNLDKTMLLIKASSYFQDKTQELSLSSSSQVSPSLSYEYIHIPEIQLPKRELLAETVNELKDNTERIIIDFNQNYIQASHISRKQLIETFKEIINQSYERILSIQDEEGEEACENCIDGIRKDFLDKSLELMESYLSQDLPEAKHQLVEGKDLIVSKFRYILNNAPARIPVVYDWEYFQESTDRQIQWQRLNYWQKFNKSGPGKKITYAFPYRLMLRTIIRVYGLSAVTELFSNYFKGNTEYINNLQKLIKTFHLSLSSIEKDLSKQENPEEFIQSEKQKLSKNLLETKNANEYWYSKYVHALLFEARRSLQEISNQFQNLEARPFIQQHRSKMRLAAQQRDKIDEAPDIWIHNQTLIARVIWIDLKSYIYQQDARSLVRQLLEELSGLIEDHVIHLIDRLDRYLQSIQIDQLLQTKPMEFKRLDITENEKLFREIVEKYFQEIKALTRELPSEVAMIPEEALNQNNGQIQEEIDFTSVSLARLFDYYMQTHFLQPVLEYTEGLPRKFQRANNVVQEVNQLLSSQIAQYKNIEEDQQALFKENLHHSIIAKKNQVEQAKKEILSIQQALYENILQALNNSFLEFSPYLDTKSAKNIQQYIRSKQNQKTLSRFERLSNNTRDKTRNLFIQLKYRQTENKLRAHHPQFVGRKKNIVEELLNLVEQVSPNKEVMLNLPLFYQQLFTQKQSFDLDFWLGREIEIEQANRILDRFADRLGGGLIIIGEHHSGRSFLSQYIAEKNFYPQNTYQIIPPEEGSIDPLVFKKAIEEAVEMPGEDYEEIFDEIALNSVFILDDIELWWERSADGFAVIDTLLGLIDQYGDQCLFILNTSQQSFRFMNMIRPIDKHFLGIVECQPFGVSDLKDIILKRHRSSPITFEYKNIPEAEMNDWRFAQLFSKYLEYSRGNIGVALQGWLSQIDSIREDVLIIKDPKLPDLSPLERIPPDWIILLVQFILHKNIHPEKLARITGEPLDTLYKHLKQLKRTGLIREKREELFVLDSFIEPHLQFEFIRLGLL